ncbi:hypothetical protein CDAR_51331 [Caerostris darwini]|uniref:Uncharacterized protein n=1 Tax=Caerostris darwini TaxID=1538125 RepID=A0AAV4U600_9ARAC|nr:hypothetical protein CDAR_51331 [Caerostris darwini]
MLPLLLNESIFPDSGRSQNSSTTHYMQCTDIRSTIAILILADSSHKLLPNARCHVGIHLSCRERPTFSLLQRCVGRSISEMKKPLYSSLMKKRRSDKTNTIYQSLCDMLWHV